MHRKFFDPAGRQAPGNAKALLYKSAVFAGEVMAMSEHTAPTDIEKKRELLRRLMAQDVADPTRIPIKPAEPGTAVFPLSFAQEELWVLDQIDPGSIAFNIAVPPIRLRGALDRP